MHRIIIFANGELPDLDQARRLLRAGDYLICADGGTRHALALARQPDLIIGDMDSAEPAQVQKLKEDGVFLELSPRDKNETDLELAIHRAVELAPNEILIMAALGGRLDQTLANIALLTGTPHPSPVTRIDDGVEEIFICRNQVEVHGRSGDLVSLIPWQGAVSDIQTKNLKWPLDHATLYSEKTRGISNEMTDETATISIGSGLLLIVHRRA